ncbi:DUF4357 domain-containing protein [Bradyrhizobium erythrophlei]|uniref:DUF4357 domain-containing protein n=1 Tax=Bradyrhizobium erythrophlei TaxID=1437360 RepID=UPI0035EEA9F2
MEGGSQAKKAGFVVGMQEPWQLPAGWELAKLADLIGADGLMVDGDWVESKDQDANGGVRLIQLADLGEGQFLNKSNRFLTEETARRLRCTYLRENDVLIARMASPLGRACIYPGLSEADISKMEAFLENILIILPAVRVDLFIQRTRPTPKVAPTAKAPSAEFILETKKHGLKANAVLVDGEFVVEAGSFARLAWEGVGSEMTSYGQLHQELRNEGVLQPQGAVNVFTKNYAFKSPSAAAAVVNGRPANGTVEWKTVDGLTYKEWEARQLAAAG